jgi:predicted GIY-YIG superfamily endonuclease
MEQQEQKAQLYILHFKQPYWGKEHHRCQHYLGYSVMGAETRIAKHKEGTGSLLVNYAYNLKDIDFEVGLVYDCESKEIARNLEKYLKKEGHYDRHCEICKKEAHNGARTDSE